MPPGQAALAAWGTGMAGSGPAWLLENQLGQFFRFQWLEKLPPKGKIDPNEVQLALKIAEMFLRVL